MKSQSNELVRYLLNGIVATAVHYMVLYTCMEIITLRSAGFSNLFASIVGIAYTFFGNRYFVFRCYGQPIFEQAIKFSGLYLSIALLNGAVLFLWTDQLGYNYKIGFLISLGLQVILGYLSSKKYVFGNKFNVCN